MKNRRTRSWTANLGIGAICATLLLAGCSRVTAESYAKLNVGMPRAEVYGILGDPDEVSGGAIGPLNFSAETWKGSDQTIHVTFGGDKVALKSIEKNPPD